jgi:hypothetical protein
MPIARYRKRQRLPSNDPIETAPTARPVHPRILFQSGPLLSRPLLNPQGLSAPIELVKLQLHLAPTPNLAQARSGLARGKGEVCPQTHCNQSDKP